MELANETSESKRPRREKTEPEICPICGLTIRQSELKQHYDIEMEKLSKISTNNKKKLLSPSSSSSSSNKTGENSKGGTSGDDCWNTYQKIKNNRQSRLKVKTRKRKAEEQTCPVCNKKTTEEITMHVEMCLRKSEHQTNGNIDSSEDEIDVDGDVYEWAGQTRVRASSLLPGGNYSSAGIGTTIRSNQDDDDEDSELNVDGDDSQVYGAPQYSERDILLVDEKENGYLRDLVIGDDPGHTSQAQAQSTESQETVDNNLPREENNQNIANSVSISKIDIDNISKLDSNGSQESAQQVIESLKQKIREYENFIKNKPSKCLICLDNFKNPVVSICCWHVYCEECWLYSLGARKLCPKCNMITSPSDLRRIYL